MPRTLPEIKTEGEMWAGEKLTLQLRPERGVTAQLAALAKRIILIRQQALPASLLAKACDYLLNQWKRFCVFATDGLLEIDNNWCEPERRPDGQPRGCPQGKRRESKRHAPDRPRP
jgi:hypothetical protein